MSGDEVGKGSDACEVLFVFFIFGRHGDAVLLFDGKTEFERVDRVQTETVHKQRCVGFDVFGLDVLKAECGDDQRLEFSCSSSFVISNLLACRFIGRGQRAGF